MAGCRYEAPKRRPRPRGDLWKPRSAGGSAKQRLGPNGRCMICKRRYEPAPTMTRSAWSLHEVSPFARVRNLALGSCRLSIEEPLRTLRPNPCPACVRFWREADIPGWRLLAQSGLPFWAPRTFTAIATASLVASIHSDPLVQWCMDPPAAGCMRSDEVDVVAFRSHRSRRTAGR